MNILSSDIKIDTNADKIIDIAVSDCRDDSAGVFIFAFNAGSFNFTKPRILPLLLEKVGEWIDDNTFIWEQGVYENFGYPVYSDGEWRLANINEGTWMLEKVDGDPWVDVVYFGTEGKIVYYPWLLPNTNFILKRICTPARIINGRK